MKIMYFYKVTLRLSGFMMNEVPKVVNAPEFLILQYIHGGDSLVNVSEIKNENINLMEERRRLKGTYDNSLSKKDQSVDKIFGPLGQLPTRLPFEILEKNNIDGSVELQEIGRADLDRVHYNNSSEPKTEKELQNLESIVSAENVRVADLME